MCNQREPKNREKSFQFLQIFDQIFFYFLCMLVLARQNYGTEKKLRKTKFSNCSGISGPNIKLWIGREKMAKSVEEFEPVLTVQVVESASIHIVYGYKPRWQQ